jgi:hypothetical protein
MDHSIRSKMPDAWLVAASLTGIHNAIVKCLFVVNRSCIEKDFRFPAMQWVLLYLSIGHDMCYLDHLAQHG